MSDCIDRQTIINLLTSRAETLRGLYGDLGGAASGVRKLVQTLPSIEPERKIGEWMLYESRSDIYDLEGVCTWGRGYRCSECGFMHWFIEDFGIYSFCPNCGAYMRGEYE